MDGWEEKCRIARLGERHDLAAAPGHWIRPQKYSVEGDEEIQQAQVRLGQGLRGETLRRLVVKARAKTGAEAGMTEVMEALDDTDLEAVLADADRAPAGAQTEYQRRVLLHGVGEHNLTEDGAPSTEVRLELVARIQKYRELAAEMAAVVARFNRPLPKASHSKSETLPGGSQPADACPSPASDTRTEQSPPS